MSKRVFIELWNNDPILAHNEVRDLEELKEKLEVGEKSGSGTFDRINANHQKYQSSFIFYTQEDV